MMESGHIAEVQLLEGFIAPSDGSANVHFTASVFHGNFRLAIPGLPVSFSRTGPGPLEAAHVKPAPAASGFAAQPLGARFAFTSVNEALGEGFILSADGRQLITGLAQDNADQVAERADADGQAVAALHVTQIEASLRGVVRFAARSRARMLALDKTADPCIDKKDIAEGLQRMQQLSLRPVQGSTE